jgi:Protein phosphatase 2C
VTASWTWAAATTRGTSHIRSGTRRQDAYRCFVSAGEPEFLVCVVSDGAGSAAYGGEGASLVCRAISLAAQEHLRTHGVLPGPVEVDLWLDALRARIALAASRRSSTPRDFAATMIAVLSTGSETFIAHVGDGCAALKDADSAEWHIPLWPDNGEYASTTSFVTDDPPAPCRTLHETARISAVAVLTDGLERIAIDFAARQPFHGFFDGMARPVFASTRKGRDRPLSTSLKHYLDGDAVCARTDDDKTLVLATCQ